MAPKGAVCQIVGGAISPLLSNIYLNELDRFFEDTLSPQYTHGDVRERNPEWNRVTGLLRAARKAEDRVLYRQLKIEQRTLPAMDPCDSGYRRLRYVRYADDFLLGFVGPASEARHIRDRIGEFLRDNLKLTLSAEKTLITHASDEKARFLGYEIQVIRIGNQIANDGRRAKNGKVSLLMPRDVVSKYRQRYSKSGKVVHRAELLDESDYTIIQRYQGVLTGLYNYYCMAYNVSQRMSNINIILGRSLLKTLALKLKRSVNEVVRMYKVPGHSPTIFRKIIERSGKEPLVAVYGGISLKRKPEGMGKDGFNVHEAWRRPASYRTEAVRALLYGECCLCGVTGVEMHHLRKLADIDRPGRRPKYLWERIMAARRRKSIPVCKPCHDDIHAGRYDGPSLRRTELESRVR